MQFLVLYLALLVLFFGIDLVWLNFVAKKLYREELGSKLRKKFEPISAILFYLIYIIGLLVFVVIPAHDLAEVNSAIVHGALFGIVTYGTYDLTNLATLKEWPVRITIIDLAWGCVIATTVSVAGFFLAQALLG